MAEKAVAFLVARLSSSRFSAKHFQPIGDRSLIEWTLTGLQQCRELDEIVITTVAEQENEPLRQFAADRQIPCFWYEGEVDHVTTRLRYAAEAYEADICLLISGDCPLMDADAIDQLLARFRNNPAADILEIQTPPGLQCGLMGVGIARRRAWILGDQLADRPEYREHHFPAFGVHRDRFTFYPCPLPAAYCGTDLRLSVDTWADLQFFNQVYQRLTDQGRAFCLPETLGLLDREPELRQFNAHVHQRRLVEPLKKVLCVVDAGGPFGYGHLMRSMELGLQIVERLSWPVHFLVRDEWAAKQLGARGLRVHHGGLTGAGRLEMPSSAADYDLVLLDLSPTHAPVADWRREWGMEGAKVVVLDRLDSWCRKADLVVIPGVAYEENEVRRQNQFVPVLAGEQYCILRREVVQAGIRDGLQERDVLLYLHSPEMRQQATRYVEQAGLSCLVIDGPREDFNRLLQTSRVLVSSFGVSCYEALALGCLPVCLPGSPRHREEARRFYRRLGLPDCTATLATLSGLLGRVLVGQEKIPPVGDGSPAIIHAMVDLVFSDERLQMEMG